MTTWWVARCDCGDESSTVPHRIVAESWAEEHAKMCSYLSGTDREVSVEEAA